MPGKITFRAVWDVTPCSLVDRYDLLEPLWKWRQCVAPKRRYISAVMYNFMYQEASIFVL